jgi:hypothetical protein
MAVGSTSLSSGAGITINIGGGAEAANSATGDTAGTDAIQADIQKLVEDLQKLSGSNATSGANSASGSDKSGKSDKSAKSHAPGQEKKADKAQNDQNSKLMDLLSKILQIFASLLGGGKDGAASGTQGGTQGVAPGEPTGAQSNGGGTVINVNSK